MKNILKISLMYISGILALLVALLVEDSTKQISATHPYFSIFIAIFLAYETLKIVISLAWKHSIENIAYKAPFLTGVLLFLNILNLVTAKLALLPTLYFPTLDRVIGTLFEDYALIGKCVIYSARILLVGVVGGIVVGFFMGVGVGFDKRLSYWIQPIVRILGPIPSTAWIPIVLVLFPSAISASEFIIGISVWFPILVMTSSGISNVEKVYFEVSSTLGASTLWQVFRVGVPAAMPSIFQGLFNGICASFITLMTAEMIGAKYGIGWYVNWQKEMMSYANVYAGLIVIAVLFYLIITVLFKGRNRLLQWQKGVIKW